MNNKRTIDVLNTLITINNDRIEGYETASKETTDQELKNLFWACIETSKTCRKELVNTVTTLGGTPAEGTKVTGKFFRTWMEVKAALASNDRRAVLASCETGEDVAVNTYEKVLQKDLSDLTTEYISMINAQHRKIKADHDKVKAMRDMWVDVD